MNYSGVKKQKIKSIPLKDFGMKICLLVHGAEAFYSGAISELLERLKHFGETEIFVTGTMAKTASLDVEFKVKIWNCLPQNF